MEIFIKMRKDDYLNILIKNNNKLLNEIIDENYDIGDKC